MNRRKAIKNAALTTSGLLLGTKGFANKKIIDTAATLQLKGTFKHSVSRWCYSKVPLEELCKTVKSFGMHSIELTGPDEWEIMKDYGLTCAIGWDKYPEGVNLNNFYSNPDNHDGLEIYFK
ncbi:MAG: hydroxypyruvate isomerase, partial [Saprospiraceae bacterium]